MKSEAVLGIKPEILRWARTTVGMSISEVADSLKRKPEEIEAWEAGHSAPTYPQLEKLAYQIYKRPLAVFFRTARGNHATAGNSEHCRKPTCKHCQEILICKSGVRMLIKLL
ncbi:MAG: helix-turn-helix transcriptional regulator [Nitrosomonas sp.]|nr:helix-turn-helix domain-containing protein [Nitrosomonas sp.]